MMKSLDRYMLREMTLPFLLALAGFVVFIMLNLMLQLSDLMLDRNVSLVHMLLMLLYRLPELLVWAVPVAILFAVFLALGRLSHDRELVAMQGAGYSLRRIVLPVLATAAVLSVADLLFHEFVTPWGNQQYYQLLREMVLKRAMPQVKDNTFFKASDDRFFYVRRYDRQSGMLQDVVVYDLTGEDYGRDSNGRFPKIVSAARAQWDGEMWHLEQGVVTALDERGLPQYTMRFETMSIRVGAALQALFVEQRTPQEMSLRELRRRIATLQRGGLSADGLLVEFHSKLAIPISGLVFALFAAPFSLIFGRRGRAAGIVLSVLFVALYQGAFLWLETWGKRELVHPVLAPWLPNIIFGLAGATLLALLDRSSRLDLWERFRRRLTALALVYLLVGLEALAWGQTPSQSPSVESEPPRLNLTADSITATATWDSLMAEGHVQLVYQRSHLRADRVSLKRDDAAWSLQAEGQTRFESDSTVLRAARLQLALRRGDNGQLHPLAGEATDFTAQSEFLNSRNERHTLRLSGSRALLSFTDDGRIAKLDISGAEFTTCACADPIARAAYSVSARSVTVYGDELLVAEQVTLRAYGLPALWMPVFFAPLKDLQQYPLLPELGQDSLRGWFAKWRIPFFLSERNYGALRLDYYHGRSELGLGVDARYAWAANGGQLSAYRLLVPDAALSLDWRHELEIKRGLMMSGAASWRAGSLLLGAERLYAEVQLTGRAAPWGFHLAASQEHLLPTGQPDEELPYRRLERFPEISITREVGGLAELPVAVGLGIGWGNYREVKSEDDPGRESTRFELAVRPRLLERSVFGRAISVRAAGAYLLSLYGPKQSRRLTEVVPSLTATPLPGLTIDADYVWREIVGETPFNFDRSTLSNRIAVAVRWAARQDLSASVKGGYDGINRKLELVSGSIAYRGSRLIADLDASWDLPRAALTQMTWRGRLSVDGGSLSFQASRDFERHRYGDLIVKADLGKGLRVAANLDLNNRMLRRVNVESVQELGSGWLVESRGEYDFRAYRFTALQLGIVRRFCQACWQMGLYVQSGQIWLQVRINAFPSAGLQYSPTDQSLVFGEGD